MQIMETISYLFQDREGDAAFPASQISMAATCRTKRYWNPRFLQSIDFKNIQLRVSRSLSKKIVFTVGKDLQINLLHPFLSHQLSLPPMLTFPKPQGSYEMFVHIVVLSSRPSNKFCTIMAIYRRCSRLAFARLGDQAGQISTSILLWSCLMTLFTIRANFTRWIVMRTYLYVILMMIKVALELQKLHHPH